MTTTTTADDAAGHPPRGRTAPPWGTPGTWWSSVSTAPSTSATSSGRSPLAGLNALAGWCADAFLEIAGATAAAVWGGLVGAGHATRAVWIADRPRRQKIRTHRRRQWWKRKGWWRFAVAVEMVGLVAWVTGRSAARVAWSSRSVATAGVRGVRTGWTEGRDRTRTHPSPATAEAAEEIVDVEVICPWQGPDGQACGAVLAEDSTDLHCPDHTQQAATPNLRGPSTATEPPNPSSDPTATAGSATPPAPVASDPTAPPAEGAGEGASAPVSVVWSHDVDAYSRGEIDVAQIRCVLCGHAPCDCPEFGSPEYLALVDRLHGRRGRAEQTDRDRRFSALREAGWTGPVDQDGWAVTDPDHWSVGTLGNRVTYPEALTEALDWIAREATNSLPCCQCVAGQDELADCRCAVGEGARTPRCTCGPWDLEQALSADDAAEDAGELEGDDRSTCHSCRSWADHAHEPLSWRRISRAAYHLQDLQRRGVLPRVLAPTETSAPLPTTPAGRPAGGSINPTDQRDDQEEQVTTRTMSTAVTSGPGRAGTVAHGGTRPLGGELASVGDLRAEVAHVTGLAEQVERLAARLRAWAVGLPEQTSAAEWRTARIDQAAVGVAQQSGSNTGMREQITELLAAVAEAERLGEVLAAGGAHGQTRGLTPQ